MSSREGDESWDFRRRFEPDELDDVAAGLPNPLTMGVFELLAIIFACPFGS